MTLTLPKLLIAALVIYFVWRYFSRLGAADRARSERRASRPQDARRGESERAESRGDPRERAIEDMVKCPKCGSYVPAKGGHDCTADAPRG